MKVAFITLAVVRRPSAGFLLRLQQIQEVLTRVAQDRLVVWDISRGAPVSLRGHSAQAELPTRGTDNRRAASVAKTLVPVLRDAAALGLHAWPSFTISLLGAQRSRILRWIDLERPTHVIVMHPNATELVPGLQARGVRTYLATHNVESDIARQLLSITPLGPRRLSALVYWRTVLKWERRYFPMVEEAWMPSDVDAGRVRHLCSGRARVRCVPNALDIRQYHHAHADHGSHDVVFPGHFGYEPNLVAAEVLRNQIIPAVRRTVSDSRLILVGRDPFGHAAVLQRRPDVIVTGEVPDIQPYLTDAGVVAVPLLHGGGTRYKILEAFALGRPVVSTALGAEGLDVRDGEHLLIRNVDEFPEAIAAILSNPFLGRKLGENGRRLVEAKYSWDSTEQIVGNALSIPNGASLAATP